MIASIYVLAATLNPGGLISWLVIGLVAGAIAHLLIRSRGFGLFGNMLIGLIGAFIGGFVVNLVTPDQTYGFWGSLLVAILGASLLFLLIGMVRSRQHAT